MAPMTTSEVAVAIDEEVTLSVGDFKYVLIPHEDLFVSFNGEDDDDTSNPILFLVYPTEPGQTISRDALCDFRTNVLDRDDVFQPAFCIHVVFYGSREQELQITPDANEELEEWNTKKRTFVQRDPSCNVAPGPLDSPEAGIDGRVIVPSRSYYKPSPSRPLNGLRVAVKDSINIQGHKTTLNNRAWRELYPPASEHAHCVQLLIDAGAIIVGKVKLQAMIVREEPVEAVEFTNPFNPRGDGYQVPSGSSSGSAAAIASYDWLDLSLGSDTNGSVRKPAHYNGCHTIRPTTGIMNTDGVVGFFPEFDMPGFFGRDLSRFPEIMSVWYEDSQMLRTPSE
ncbi:hypothetical protein Hte_005311, partial [Hypoxylon texense]